MNLLTILPIAIFLAAPVQGAADGNSVMTAEAAESCESVVEALKEVPMPEGDTYNLEQIVNAVLDYSPNLKEAEQKLIQVKKSIGQVRAALIPSVSVSGTLLLNSSETKMKMPDFQGIFDNLAGVMTGTYEIEYAELTMNPRTAASFSGNITIPLFIPQAYPSLKQMRSTIKSTEMTLDNVVRQLASGVVSLYGATLANQKVLNINKMAVLLAENHYRASKIQNSSGMGSPIQISQAELALQQAVSSLVSAQYTYNQMLDTLSIMSGLKIGRVEELDWTEMAIPNLDEAVKNARESRLDFKIAEENIVAAKKALLTNKMAYLPNIVAQGSVSSSTVKNMDGKNTTASAMLVAQWNLFDGLARESKIGSAKAAVKEKELNLQTMENDLRKELSEALIKLRQTQSSSILMKKQLALAKTNFEAVEYSFNSGAISNLEYDDASANFTQAQLQETATDIQAIMARTSLYYSMGNLEELLPNVNLDRFSGSSDKNNKKAEDKSSSSDN